MFDAVVLAGGGKIEPLTEQEGVSNKAFILLDGKPLLGYILEALTNARSIGRIAVVGPAGELNHFREAGFGFTLVPEDGGMLDNLAAGLRAVGRDRHCLVATGDIPLLNEAVVEGFLSLCRPYDADFYYPILTRESCEARFPEMKRTYVRLREGAYTGGNVALLQPAWFNRNRGRLEMFIAYRKKPLKLMRLLPPLFILKYLGKRLSIADLEERLSHLMHLKARAVPCDYVEIGTDVDKPSDLSVVRRAVSG